MEYQVPTSLAGKEQKTSTFRVDKYGSVEDYTGVDLAHLLQYGAVEGHPYLLKRVKEVIEYGIRPASEWETLMTCGSTDGLSKILSIVARQGDLVLVEKYTYASFIAAAVPLGVSPVAVEIDDEGMSSKHLQQTLAKCRAEGTRMPRLIYLVTVGQNPTGTVMSAQRKKEIIALANEYDVLVIEDDPYFFLQFNAEKAARATAYLPEADSDDFSESDFEDLSIEPGNSLQLGRTQQKQPRGEKEAIKYCQAYFETLVPSMLRFDSQGRVFRVETFSKVIGPGMRLGHITTSPVFYNALLLLSQSSTQAPSGLSMAFAAKLLFQHGLKGWCQWTAGLRVQYQMRRDHMLSLLTKEFSTSDSESLADWTVPEGGMFIWFRVNIKLLPTQHMTRSDSTKDIMMRLWIKLAESKVLIVPGWSFAATPAIAEWKTNFFRLTYASSTMEDMDVGVKIMGEVLREFFQASP